MKHSSVLVGLTLLLAGSAIILSILFHIQLPVWRLLLAGVFIYTGAVLLYRFFRKDGLQHLAIGTFEVAPLSGTAQHIRILLAHGILDLSALSLQHHDIELTLEVLLARVEIRVHPDMPLIIDLTSLLGDCRLPDGSHLMLGQTTAAFKMPKRPCIRLKLTATLASVRFISYVSSEQQVPLSAVITEI